MKSIFELISGDNKRPAEAGEKGNKEVKKTKDSIFTNVKNILPFDNIELGFPDDISNILEVKLKKEENDIKQLNQFLNDYPEIEKSYNGIILKYINQISIPGNTIFDTINNLFLEIGVIKRSTLQNKDTILDIIFELLERENILVYNSYINDLVLNNDGKKGFPTKVANSLIIIDGLIIKLFPERKPGLNI